MKLQILCPLLNVSSLFLAKSLHSELTFPLRKLQSRILYSKGRHLQDPSIPLTNPTVEEEEVAEAIQSCLQEDPCSGVKVFLTRKPFRGTKKAFVRLKEAPAQTLLKANHIKIGWVSCMVRRKTEINRCYRYLLPTLPCFVYFRVLNNGKFSIILIEIKHSKDSTSSSFKSAL